MTLKFHDAGGRQYLDLVTALLQRVRLADATAGVWEAADLQWWWRRDQHDDPRNATFWFDDGDEPIAAVILTDWGEGWGVDVIEVPDDDRFERPALWPHAVERMRHMAGKPIETSVRDDDPPTTVRLTATGFSALDEVVVSCWMPATQRPAVTPLPDGYRLVPRSSSTDRPHHLIPRSGPSVAERLLECSLYRPDLDLAVVAPDGGIAAYGLFWADPVTGVGLVEPMRTEDEHQGRGLAKHVLTAGLELLAANGCERLKVSYVDGNDAARRLYLDAGFRAHSRSTTLVRSVE